MKVKLTGKRTVVTVALLAAVGVLYVQGKDQQAQQNPTSSETTTLTCRVASTEDGVRVRSAPVVDPANVVDELAKDEQSDASKEIQNGFRKLSEGHWVSVQYIRPLDATKC
ncbi:hypothetical protein [Actinophytocola sp.]|uniref:hypothetical protein n=1 Tax=Actinophytocola sp. TaxID=1872138 RepID=UPI00389A17CE